MLVSYTREQCEYSLSPMRVDPMLTVISRSIITPRSTFTSNRYIVNWVPKAIQTRSETALLLFALQRRNLRTSRQDDRAIQNGARLRYFRDLNSWTSRFLCKHFPIRTRRWCCMWPSLDIRRFITLSLMIFVQQACLMAMSFRWQNGLSSSNAI